MDSTPSDDPRRWEILYHQVSGQLAAARSAETLLREQVEQLRERLRAQERLYELRISELQQQQQLSNREFLDRETAVFLPRHGDSRHSFTAAFLAETHYAAVCERFRTYLHPTAACGGDLWDLCNFWKAMGGAGRFFSRHPPQTLDALLARDDRPTHTLSTDYADAESHRYLECVAARLRNLQCLSLGGRAYTVDVDFMMTANSGAPAEAFHSLHTLDVSKCSTLTATQLARLLSVMKNVRTIRVHGCEALAWEEIVAVVVAAGSHPVAVEPNTEEAFRVSKDAQFVSRIAADYVTNTRMVGRLLNLWSDFAGPQGLHDGMTPTRLTAVLAHSDITSLTVGGALGKGVPNAALVPPEEMTDFVSTILSRLPKLQQLTLTHCTHGWPFDLNRLASVAGTGVDHPFPALKHVSVENTKWQPEDLVGTVRMIPSLNNSLAERDKNGKVPPAAMALEVQMADGPEGVDVMEVRQACEGKLYIWAS